MRLIVAHKILISAFLVLCAILLVRGIRMYAAIQSTTDLVLGVAAGLIGVAISFYLRRIWSK
jgi:hypothetical protein